MLRLITSLAAFLGLALGAVFLSNFRFVCLILMLFAGVDAVTDIRAMPTRRKKS